ncbi:hypothetical protein BCR41DRAFT_309370 [Lobosporangium transversale]|uniref:RRM domain-containing protein n=1 Tax=Lobosporangium transversale TaxID=64571 RepID=A0A1Y2GFR3_9FUNG|nr:hypothetical protein BCR41DRAFT_309370 [Lobosporangium transversale]ORZ09671.1 hypothetical protein BCR41DRAFT_309370 [Lobosporangium transversale]|eukprot:XP_021878941.1 hypothetical protein BCR41DRAFT_309370 [Lobosporangium transversale]
MDPSYNATTTTVVQPAYDPTYAQYQSQSYSTGPVAPSSIPASLGSTAPPTIGSGGYRAYGVGTGGYRSHNSGYYAAAVGGTGSKQSYINSASIANSEYEDLNKLFVDPKKAQEEAAAAAAKAEEEERAAKAKASATVIRKAAGQIWQDASLLEFDENDFRLFAGDLGNEVTDELLTKTFSKYPSFLKAKVVRDKRTQKTKGYGFISFAEPDDFARAWKEMDGKYVGNRPIKLRKSQWKDRNVEIIKDPKTVKGPYDLEALSRKERAKPYKIKKLNNAGK